MIKIKIKTMYRCDSCGKEENLDTEQDVVMDARYSDYAKDFNTTIKGNLPVSWVLTPINKLVCSLNCVRDVYGAYAIKLRDLESKKYNDRILGELKK